MPGLMIGLGLLASSAIAHYGFDSTTYTWICGVSGVLTLMVTNSEQDRAEDRSDQIYDHEKDEILLKKLKEAYPTEMKIMAKDYDIL